jgi:aspartyl-tRNA(Asn)/glutamyl-tRNA(Gln) amidotransferase subunit B
MAESQGPYRIIIGLETHVQLLTESKLFCACSTSFGAEPNTQVCPVCLGMPGAMPVMNRRAFGLAVKTALALNCEIPHFTKWDRKNYYYPDLPKGYQISQYDLPLSREGYLSIPLDEEGRETKKIGIIRAHLEEDAGKSLHDEKAHTADSRIDLNRTGVPLLEIVSHPDMNSPEEAYNYLTELKLLLQYIGVSDCNMQEGSLRVDANINLHIEPTAENNLKEIFVTPIVEVKNLNSFRAVRRAMEYEAHRQYEDFLEQLESGRETDTSRLFSGSTKQTWLWDENAQITRCMRSKEESSDYRYFPEPDLVPVILAQEEIDRIRDELPELPADLRRRLQEEHQLTAYDAEVLVGRGRGVTDYFFALQKSCGDAKQASNWIQQDVLRVLNEKEMEIDEFSISPESLGELIKKIKGGEVPRPRARDVFDAMLESGKTVAETMKDLGIEGVDTGELEAICRQLLQENPNVVEDVKNGKVKAVGSLIGKAKQVNPNVNPNEVRQLCLKLIETG